MKFGPTELALIEECSQGALNEGNEGVKAAWAKLNAAEKRGLSKFIVVGK